MSRSGYSEDCDNLDLYRASVDRALQGRRGQAFLRELIEALDALPEKILITGELIAENGACCAIGSVCQSRAIDVSKIDYEEPRMVGAALGIAPSMAAEIAFMNDEWEGPRETSEDRWARMRRWAVNNLACSS